MCPLFTSKCMDRDRGKYAPHTLDKIVHTEQGAFMFPGSNDTDHSAIVILAPQMNNNWRDDMASWQPELSCGHHHGVLAFARSRGLKFVGHHLSPRSISDSDSNQPGAVFPSSGERRVDDPRCACSPAPVVRSPSPAAVSVRVVLACRSLRRQGTLHRCTPVCWVYRRVY
jgi:hypothetical protein